LEYKEICEFAYNLLSGYYSTQITLANINYSVLLMQEIFSIIRLALLTFLIFGVSGSLVKVHQQENNKRK
jgi:hypothetical protein